MRQIGSICLLKWTSSDVDDVNVSVNHAFCQCTKYSPWKKQNVKVSSLDRLFASITRNFFMYEKGKLVLRVKFS